MKNTLIFVVGALIGFLTGIWLPDSDKNPMETAYEPAKNAAPENRPVQNKEDGTYFGYVKSAENKPDGTYISVDYATYGSCTEAMIEADNCPNGYFISNVNPKLRAFRFNESAVIVMQTFSHNETGNFKSNQIIPLGEFLHPQNARLKDLPYWFTIADGEIVEIREQFLP